MTNEQLAEFIQLGEANDLTSVLWERVKHLMFKICGQYYGRYSERFAACGVELSDLRQECYPAFLVALKSFKPAEGNSFASYLKYPIKNACAQLLGIRNRDRLNKQPLDNCTSLDVPLNSEEDAEITLVAAIRDETAEQAFENALNSIQDEQTREVLTKALSRLTKPLRDVIMLYYFEGMTQEAIAEQAGVSGECIRQRKNQALRKLRAMPDVQILREEQRIEKTLHFSSRDNSIAYYQAQKRIAEILKRGDYLSYGKKQAILHDCRIRAFLNGCAEYTSVDGAEVSPYG